MPRQGLTPESVVLAAADLADETGLDRVTVSGLARRLGVRDASLYSHVRSLDDLRVRIALRASDELAGLLADAVAGRAGRDALGAFGSAYRAYALSHPGRYASTHRQLDADVVASTPSVQRILDLTSAMFRGYGLAEEDLTDAVRLVRSTFHGFATLEAAGGFGHPRDLESSWHRALDALDYLLRHWPEAHP
ncbi:TetR/AcrR family transcriptional regulator [Cryptosporangium phraense]|uniref:TetR/AcrR family transcriptional regulator n=1 Tax=Cryptosporangium phraense TaxID=2593070 RepID=A0A545AEJ4_9ACTN|nr:TetR/AcrR family transcriptional regulator [Cryptosporangium phraense]TQS39733.1 TetR/AcrR family transcriptional regulator [Cryptosporangium phraense]